MIQVIATTESKYRGQKAVCDVKRHAECLSDERLVRLPLMNVVMTMTCDLCRRLERPARKVFFSERTGLGSHLSCWAIVVH
jgi:hypothetical protein